jgi:hypothetical protein
MQHRMIALARRVFKCGGNVACFKQWIICENFLAGCSGSKQVKHVPDADAQPPQAGTSAALVRIDRYTVYFAHRCLPASSNGKSLRTGKLTGNVWKFRTIPISLGGFRSRSPSGFNGLQPIPRSPENREIFLHEQGIVGR